MPGGCSSCGGRTPSAMGARLANGQQGTSDAEADAYTGGWGSQLKGGALLIGPGYVEAMRLVRCRGGQLVQITADQMAQLVEAGAEPASCAEE